MLATLHSLSSEATLWLTSLVLASARMAPVFFVLPFLNTSVLTGVMRQTVIMVVAIGLWPHPVSALAPIPAVTMLTMIAGEALIGIVLACLLSWPFWVFHAVGSFIDNQRGATLSSSIDPANGIDTSEMANFFNLFAAAIYLQGGGMQLMLNMFAQSYQLCDPLLACQMQFQPLASVLTSFMGQALVLSSPVVIALLLTEALLGLLSRFAPQMNAFSIALTVKSAVALIMLLLYFGPLLSGEVMNLRRDPATLSNWFTVPKANDGSQ
ncbi:MULTISPECIES: type III secretion system export apparatus subunit SctT [unclassified Undibacterium]|uniref:type III secretion system export apparatus subunit SctT n=1 Tax=unclassified Undibacterium TaxID=2630295 RepID=UPI002AC9EFAC|nr:MULTISPECIES: type III secretion system export apparatus subunit SctT [unclassified Undibacterium]MEB0140386.1 type III secretion system export apparatus subunit SctT [Undibacterium sp. CCC2.1]MEB0173420.1 type III secretion system export apparatus subunit SctT [Undibacterium sp. CCC1.1]MEB0177320.1 type III secretion system export apparatus subunit SctT [Undibacterium sp. CCC3.4]MEB0216577.1 type III secretion system export apparatus subunit SctT [Undibacterium sp. 5I2]WPX43479.1 type III 